ncbi:MAG: efflux RND transporter permease subunit, partial [Acidobacteriota bacterium]
VQERLAAGLDWVISRIYRPVLDMALSWRYTTVAIACAALLITVSAMTSNVIGFAFYPSVEPDNLVVYVTMPLGTPARQTAATLEQIEENAFALQRELAASGHESVFRHVMTTVGEQPFRQRQANVFTPGTASSGHIGEVNVELSPAETRGIAASELVRRWRDITGPIPDAVDVSFVSSLIAPGGAIDIRLSGPDLDQLRWAATELKTELARYPGVVDIGDSLRRGKRELELDVTSEAEACGITRGDLARQVRQAFYGEEAQRIQRGRDDVRVMVRYPERDRQSLSTLQEMRIRTPDGREMPFAVVGRAEMGRGFASIVRTDGRRTVDVVADVDTTINDPNEIIADLQTSFLPRLLAEAPGLSYRLEGQQRDQRETLGGLQRGFLISLFVIYALLAIPFRSYLQPLIVMSAIPFGVIGAIWGHVLLGHTVTILSAFGIVALVGVVVNDSLVMVDFINRAYRAGTPLLEAIRAAGAIRFRPILLTSLTTFVGLLPLILERSLQAQFLIPMAISLAFGVIFATGIILILVPVGYTILEDAKALVGRVLGIDTTPAADPTPHEA